MKLSIGMAVMALCATAICGVRDERLRELRNICAYEPSDDLTVAESIPTPDVVIRKYNITTNEVVQDLWALVASCGISATNSESAAVREGAVLFIGKYGCTNDLGQLAAILTNRADCAQEAALNASYRISKCLPTLIPLARSIITNDVAFSAATRRLANVRLLDYCQENKSDDYINDPAQHARIAAFFLERAALDRERPLGADRCACQLNPSYRHSQQRRDNLAALRPPGLTGRPAELYDAAQRDAAQGE